jgi:HEAT repeat protein
VPLLPLISVTVLGAVLAGMLVFMLGRRAWRAAGFRRRDHFRAYWYRRLPGLLRGETPTAVEMRAPESREMLEAMILHRREAAEPEDRKRLQELAERSGLLEERIRRARKGPRWDRLESVRVLGQFRSPAAVPALERALEDSWAPLAAEALRSLGMIASPSAGPAIVQCLERGVPVEPNIWLDGAVACVTNPEEFVRLVQNDRAEVRALAARALAESPQTPPYDLLQPLAFHPDPEVRGQVARALGRARDERAVPLLVAATQDEAWFVRLRAVMALGEAGAVSALDAVLRALQDPNFQVRQRAAASLASLVSRPGEAVQMVVATHDDYAVEGLLSCLTRSGLLWRSLELLRQPQSNLGQDAAKLAKEALAAGYYPLYLNAVETYPDWRVRTAVARLLAASDHPELAAELERRAEAAPTPRSRRLLRAVLRSRSSRSQSSRLGEQPRERMARPA